MNRGKKGKIMTIFRFSDFFKYKSTIRLSL